MKKSMAVISAFIIGTGGFSSEMAVMAQEPLFGEGLNLGNELDFENSSNLLKEVEIEYPGKNKDLFNIQEQKDFEEEPVKDEKEIPEKKEEETAPEDRAEIKDLQIPQKLEIVIDPWEMDGKEQIYSEQYTIRNIGEMQGVLRLSGLSCRPQENSSTVIRTDKNGLHDNKEKSVYMEILFGNGDHVVLSEEGTEYKAELEPDEELTFCFTGEVNEYAEEGWEKGEIAVEVVYSWDEEAAQDQENRVEETETDDTVTEEDIGQMDESEDDGENSSVNDMELVEEELPMIDEFVQESGENEENQGKVIDLQVIQKAGIEIGSWMIEEKEQGSRMISEEYVLKNTGEEAGMLTLTELTCRISEESGIIVRTKKEELYDSEECSVYVEMIPGNGDNMILSEESLDYQVELKPGEELAFRFQGEINESAEACIEEGAVLVTAVCAFHQMTGR